MAERKYDYTWTLQGHYGAQHGWEDLCSEKLKSEIRKRCNEYMENEGGRYRIVKRREPR